MKTIVPKLLVAAGGFLSIIGLFPIVGLYPSKMWDTPTEYWRYVFISSDEFLWKIGLLLLLLGIIVSFLSKLDQRMKLFVLSVLAVMMSFITAVVEVNEWIPSGVLVLYPISVLLFIAVIVYGLRSKLL